MTPEEFREAQRIASADVRVVPLYGDTWAIYGPSPTGSGIARLYCCHSYAEAMAAAHGEAERILAAESGSATIYLAGVLALVVVPVLAFVVRVFGEVQGVLS